MKYNIHDGHAIKDTRFNRHISAFIRIIKHEIIKYNYPKIDIYVDTRRVYRRLGTFRANLKTNDVSITLYIKTFMRSNYPIIALKQTIKHEYYHFKQWLLNNGIKHDNMIKSKIDTNNKRLLIESYNSITL